LPHVHCTSVVNVVTKEPCVIILKTTHMRVYNSDEMLHNNSQAEYKYHTYLSVS